MESTNAFRKETSFLKSVLIKDFDKADSSLVLFATLALQTPILETKEVKTAYTNGKDIFLNLEFIQGLSLAQKRFVLMHELMHIALEHLNRRGSRDPYLWNVACDYSINHMLCNYNRDVLKMPSVGLYDSQYANMSPEAIYEKLKKDSPPPKELAWADIMGDSMDAADIQELHEKLVTALETCKVMNNEPGKLPAHLERLFNQLQKPKLPWKQILARWLNNKVKGKYDWKRPSRRLQIMNVVMPSRRFEGVERLDFLIDVSGSITDKQFVTCLSEIEGVIKQFKPRELVISQFDTKFLGSDTVNQYSSMKNIKLKGGGGTLIKSSIDELSKSGTKAIIVFTDGYIGDLEQVNTNKPVVWLVYDNPSFEPPCGKKVEIEIDK